MKSTIKIYKDDLADFYNYLQSQEGVEVNTEVVEWRALMWRKNSVQWTQAYDGKTRSGKNNRSFLRAFGPEEFFVEQFYTEVKS